jgi:hypothetical protein
LGVEKPFFDGIVHSLAADAQLFCGFRDGVLSPFCSHHPLRITFRLNLSKFFAIRGSEYVGHSADKIPANNGCAVQRPNIAYDCRNNISAASGASALRSNL